MLSVSPAFDYAPILGTEIGVSNWHKLEQAQIDAFADATGDHQWLHVDRDRAAAGPYGATIAHGFLLLSMLPALADQVVRFTQHGGVINYGLDRVRFPSPAKAGGSIRDRITLESAESARGGVLLTMEHTIEVRGNDKPACVARQLRLVLDKL